MFGNPFVWQGGNIVTFLHSLLCEQQKGVTFAADFREAKSSGCGAVRLAHLVWDQEVEGSNPFIPTNDRQLVGYLSFLFINGVRIFRAKGGVYAGGVTENLCTLYKIQRW